MSATRAGKELSAETRAAIKKIVCDVLEVDPADVTDTTRFVEDLDADSLRTIEILAEMERTLGFDLSAAPIEGMTNLDGVYAVVAESEAK
ncbi:acyl carrier protein [Streptomyces sp. NEAU-sy36]|uniref:acyl carrier protein n=1 Tax=unclassified Streptomyces TaxID=2593676 RepID=UPI0015D63278|nr:MULTISPECIES: acyl carrier protein [unclassified Streptomyces]QLJ04405.1 acyl carrier protein [Streptomyces sp. NEAU-sy36]